MMQSLNNYLLAESYLFGKIFGLFLELLEIQKRAFFITENIELMSAGDMLDPTSNLLIKPQNLAGRMT